MIKIVSAITHQSHLYKPVQEAIKNIQEKMDAVDSNDALRMVLREMRFDPRFTKPIDHNALSIIQTLRKIPDTVWILPYRQNLFAWYSTPVNGYVSSKNPLMINLNTRQNRSAQDWEGTIWHELIHVADAFSVASFSHGENSLKGKESTAPVKLARFLSSLTLPKGRSA